MIGVPPVHYGNPDPDWAPQARQPAVANNGIQNQIVIWELDANQRPPLSRRCMLLLFSVSTLLVMRVQQDKYAEAARWHGGVLDNTGPFPWEVEALVGKNDSFQATFLAPVLRRASTFMQPSQANSAMIITGLGRTPAGHDGVLSAQQAGSSEALLPELSAVIPDASLAGLSGACLLGNRSGHAVVGRAVCYVALQRVVEPSESPLSNASELTCHRFVSGSSLASLERLPSRTPADRWTHPGKERHLCVRSPRIHSAMPTFVSSSVVLAWDPVISREEQQVMMREGRQKPVTCLAAVEFPSLWSGPAIAVDLASTVFADKASSSVISVGYSASQTLVVEQFNAATLELRWRYRLPVTVAWLLHTSRVSDGYLLFVGAEQPYVGTTFAVDLKTADVYEQDPLPAAASRRAPKRRRLPRDPFVEAGSGAAPTAASPAAALQAHPSLCTLTTSPPHTAAPEGAA